MKEADKEFVREVIEDFSDMLYKIIISRISCREDAQDILHDVFYKFIVHDKSFETKEDIKFWLIRVAINHVKNYNMKRYKEIPYIDEMLEKEKGVSDSLELDNSIEYIRMLPHVQSTICFLYYHEGYTTDEIAKILNSSPSTVRNNLAKARKNLKQIITDISFS